MINTAFIMYSHSSYSDVWPLFFGQVEKYLINFFKQNIQKYVFINQFSEQIPSSYKQIIYDDKLTYSERMFECLQHVEENYIFFQHEDMILYDQPDLEKIKQIPQILENSEQSFVKLIKGGVAWDISTQFDWLKFIPSNSEYVFSVQPSIWKKEPLLNIYKNFLNCDIWSLEIKSQKWCRDNNITGYYTFTDLEEQRGQLHWDSKIYPYIATAIVKKRWNYSEYKKELDKLFLIYNIDPNLRGTR